MKLSSEKIIFYFLRVLKTNKIKEIRKVYLLILQIFNENKIIKKKNEKEKTIGSIINKNQIGKKKKQKNKFFENNKK